MTLLDKTLRLSLFAGAALLFTACPPTNKCDSGEVCESGVSDADTDTDSDADTDADTDTDTVETGLAQFYFVGEFVTSGGEYTSGSAGYALVGLDSGDVLCELTGELPYEGEGPAGCPDCSWAFDVGGAENSTGVGDYCDQFGWTDGSLDGYMDYGWGYAPVYYYDYNGTPLALEKAIMLYLGGDTDYWFSFAFNYGGRDWVYGDETDAYFVRPGFSSSGGYAYYYYYPY
jgi:hypothetical protein